MCNSYIANNKWHACLSACSGMQAKLDVHRSIAVLSVFSSYTNS